MVEKITIDAVDRQILSALSKDGRMSLSELAEHVGLSATPCKRRLTKLEDSGIISGYAAVIDHKASGFGITVFVSVELERQKGEELILFEKRVMQFDEVVTGTLMTGSQDFLLEVVVESLEAYEVFLQTKLLQFDGVRSVRSRFALRKFVKRSRVI